MAVSGAVWKPVPLSTPPSGADGGGCKTAQQVATAVGTDGTSAPPQGGQRRHRRRSGGVAASTPPSRGLGHQVVDWHRLQPPYITVAGFHHRPGERAGLGSEREREREREDDGHRWCCYDPPTTTRSVAGCISTNWFSVAPVPRQLILYFTTSQLSR